MGYVKNMSGLGAVTLVRDHRKGAKAPEYVRREGETRAQAQARADADPAAAAAEAAQYKPGYKPPAPDAGQDAGGGGGALAPQTSFFGIPGTYLLLGGAGLLAFLLLRRKKPVAQ